MRLATGNAIEAVLDAVRIRLQADTTLAALVTGIYGHLPGALRTDYPYLVIGEPALDAEAYGAMGAGGGRLLFAIDGWSNARGPHAIRAIMARVKVLLMRHDLTVTGHQLAGGSLTTVEDRDFPEPDPEMPDERLYHGHQTWEVLVEEA